MQVIPLQTTIAHESSLGKTDLKTFKHKISLNVKSGKIKSAVDIDCPTSRRVLIHWYGDRSCNSSTYFFLDILRFFFHIAVSIQAQKIHFKRGQSEDYVGVTMVQVSYRYIFLLVCYRYRWHFETPTWGVAPSDCFKMPSDICSNLKEK